MNEDEDTAVLRQSIGNTISEKHELIEKIEEISRCLTIISGQHDNPEHSTLSSDPNLIFQRTTFHDKGRHLIALMDNIIGYEALEPDMQTEVRTRSFQTLCLMSRTLICTGMKMSPSVLSHPGIVYILPPESEQFVPDLSEYGGDGDEKTMGVDGQTVLAAEGDDRLAIQAQDQDQDQGQAQEDDEECALEVGHDMRSRGGRLRPRSRREYETSEEGRDRGGSDIMNTEDFDSEVLRVLPRMRDTLSKLREFESTIEGVMNVFEAYNTASICGPPALRRTYVEAAKSRRQRSWQVLANLESKNVTNVDLLDLMEPRTMYLQTGMLYLRKTDSATEVTQLDSEALATDADSKMRPFRRSSVDDVDVGSSRRSILLDEKREDEDDDVGYDDEGDGARSDVSSESDDYRDSIESGVGGGESSRQFEIFYDDAFDGCSTAGNVGFGLADKQQVLPHTRCSTAKRNRDDDTWAPKGGGASSSSSSRRAKKLVIRKFVSETQNQDALRIALNHDVDEFVGSPLVSAYVRDQMIGHDPKLHAHIQTIHSLVRSRSLPEGSMRSMELVYHGFMNLVVSPQVLLSTPWVLMGLDFIQSFLMAITMTMLSWRAPGSRASIFPILLQGIVCLSSFEFTEKYLSLHATSHPLSETSRIYLRRRKFRTRYSIPIVSFIRKCTANCAGVASLLNVAIAATRSGLLFADDHAGAGGAAAGVVVDPAALHLRTYYNVLILCESSASALLATLCILNLCKVGFLWKSTGRVLSAIEGSIGDLSSAVSISCISVMAFATALHALAIHHKELGGQLGEGLPQAFGQGVFESCIILVDMVISKKTFYIFSKEGDIMRNAFSASMTGILMVYSLFANVLVMNLILSIVVSVYRSISQQDSKFYACRTKIMYSYVQDSRLKIIPGPVGVFVGLLRYVFGSTVSRFIFSTSLAVTFIPIAACIWSLLFVRCMWAVVTHQIWIIYGKHTFMLKDERRNLTFPYLFIILDRIGGCDSTIGSWICAFICALIFLVFAIVITPLFPLFICAHFVFKYTTMADSLGTAIM